MGFAGGVEEAVVGGDEVEVVAFPFEFDGGLAVGVGAVAVFDDVEVGVGEGVVGVGDGAVHGGGFVVVPGGGFVVFGVGFAALAEVFGFEVLPEAEHADEVGVFGELGGFAEGVEAGTLAPGFLLGLGEDDDGDVAFLGEQLEAFGDVHHFLSAVAAAFFGVGGDELGVVDEEGGEAVAHDGVAGFDAEFLDADAGAEFKVDAGGFGGGEGAEEVFFFFVGDVASVHLVHFDLGEGDQ